MSLKIRLKNLGILKHAEFSLGDLTLICGKNNTGKTYTAYALHGFLQLWRGLIDFEVSDAQVRSLLTDGGIKVGLGDMSKRQIGCSKRRVNNIPSNSTMFLQ